MVEIQDDDTRGTLIQRLPDISELGVGTGLGGAVQSAMHILANTYLGESYKGAITPIN